MVDTSSRFGEKKPLAGAEAWNLLYMDRFFQSCLTIASWNFPSTCRNFTDRRTEEG